MSDSPLIRMLCPRLTCQQVLSVSADHRGRLVRCHRCGAVVRVPARPAEPAAADEAGGVDAKKAA